MVAFWFTNLILENIMSNVNMTIDEMKTRAAALQAEFEGIQADLELKICLGPRGGMADRLRAFQLVKRGYSSVENVYLYEAAGNSLHSSLVAMAGVVVQAMKDRYGVEETVIASFVCETNTLFIPIFEKLLAAKAQLVEAEAQQLNSLKPRRFAVIAIWLVVIVAVCVAAIVIFPSIYANTVGSTVEPDVSTNNNHWMSDSSGWQQE
jgi:hypothetical protein